MAKYLKILINQLNFENILFWVLLSGWGVVSIIIIFSKKKDKLNKIYDMRE